MADPGNELTPAAPGFGHLRASHADREYIIGILKAAFVQGRLTKEELEERVSQTFASRTYADLAALTADLPVGLVSAEPLREPVPAQAAQPVNKPLLWGACGVTVAGMGFVAAGIPAASVMLLTIGVFAILIAVPVAGTLLLDAWRENHPGGRLPPRPAQRGQAPGAGQRGSIGNDRSLSEARNDIRAPHLPGIRVIRGHVLVLTARQEQPVAASLQVAT